LESGVPASIVVVSADGGWKYLSTGAWTDDLDEVTERAKSIIYF
jgi:cysteine synthase B